MAIAVREKEKRKEPPPRAGSRPQAGKTERGKQFEVLYKKLNAEQQKAVDAIEGPVMVLAGPGTGKTQVLTMRIAKILKETQMDPWNILCLTFTDSAAVEMRERLTSIIGTPAYYVHIQTFHSFCNEIIQEHPDVFALARDMLPLSDAERVELMQILLDELPGTSKLKPLGNPYLFLKDITQAIQVLKQEDVSLRAFKDLLRQLSSFEKSVRKSFTAFVMQKPSERSFTSCERIHRAFIKSAEQHKIAPSFRHLIDRHFDVYTHSVVQTETKGDESKAATKYKNSIKRWFESVARNLPKQRDLAKLYAVYQKQLQLRGRYDFEDMVMMVVEELKRNDELLATLQEQFQYILVDEFQDTNGAQNEVVRLFGSFDDQPNIFVVGDDKQSIYRFQGASLNNMLDFYRRYKEHLQIISLKHNYRSQPYIIHAAQNVIQNNQESIGKYIAGVSDELSPQVRLPLKRIELYECESEEQEEYTIASQIKKHIDEGVRPADIAVLFRYHRDGEGIARALQSLNVPIRLEAGGNALDDILVQQFLTLVSYVAGNASDSDLADLMQFQWLTLDALDALKCIHLAGTRRISLLSTLSSRDLLQEANVQDDESIIEFVRHIAAWKTMSQNDTLQTVLTTIAKESGFLQFLTDDTRRIQSLQHLSTVMREAKGLHASQRNISLRAFMRHVALLQEHNIPLASRPWEAMQDAVRLMTAHRAKGQEFTCVYICRLNDRHWGGNRDVNRIPLPSGLLRYDFVIAQENNEDERRLFYVAMTRAKKMLAMTRAKHNGAGRPTVPSLFLQELPEEVVTHIGVRETHDEARRRLIASISPVPENSPEEGIRSWLQEQLKTYTMSVTHLNNYLECPRKFYVQNILHVPSVRTPHQALGSAIHQALRDLVLVFHSATYIKQRKFLLGAFENYLTREYLTETQFKHALDVGRDQLGRYFDHTEKVLMQDAIAEYDFRSHRVMIGDLHITGKIDKIELVASLDPTSLNLPAGQAGLRGTSKGRKRGVSSWPKGSPVNVVDYKTGNPDRGMAKLRRGGDYFRQLVFYKLLCDLSPRFPYVMESAEINFIQKSEKRGFLKKKLVITEGEVKDLKSAIVRVWQEIKGLKFLEKDAWCGKCEVCMGRSGAARIT